MVEKNVWRKDQTFFSLYICPFLNDENWQVFARSQRIYKFDTRFDHSAPGFKTYDF